MTEQWIKNPALVEIVINPAGNFVWVNVDGVCRLKAARIAKLVVTDDRVEPSPPCRPYGGSDA